MPISGQSSLTGVQSGMKAPCDISLILSFLQELQDKGCTPFMLKVYMAAITANHTSHGWPVGWKEQINDTVLERGLKAESTSPLF